MLNFAQIDEDEPNDYSLVETQSYMSHALFEDLPQLFLKTTNTINVGYTLSWWEGISIFISLVSAVKGVTSYTLQVLKGNFTFGPGIQWILASLGLIIIGYDIGT